MISPVRRAATEKAGEVPLFLPLPLSRVIDTPLGIAKHCLIIFNATPETGPLVALPAPCHQHPQPICHCLAPFFQCPPTVTHFPVPPAAPC